MPPLAHTFRSAYTDRWVRFHSLPGSKRYPGSEEEYARVIDRYDTVLFVTPRRELHPNGMLWWTESVEDDPDPDFHTHTRLYADRRPWRRGCIDDLLLAVADEALVEVFVTDTDLRRIHHPYDGGADVILSTPGERDRLRGRHFDWLSGHPAGL